MKRALLWITLAGCSHGSGDHKPAPAESAHAGPSCSPVTYTRSASGIQRIIVHGDQLFTVRNKAIEVYPLAGGAAKQLAASPIDDIAIVDNKLIGVLDDGSGLVEMSLDGTSSKSISRVMDVASEIAPLDHGYIVVGQSDVYRVTPDGVVDAMFKTPNPQTTVGHVTAVHGGHAYMAVDNAVLELGTSGPGRKVFEAKAGRPERVVAGTHSLFTNVVQVVEGGPTKQSIWAIDFANEQAHIVAPNYGQGALDLLAATDDTAYAIFGSQIMRIDKDKLTPVTVAPGSILTLLVDGNTVYWATDEGYLERACLSS